MNVKHILKRIFPLPAYNANRMEERIAAELYANCDRIAAELRANCAADYKKILSLCNYAALCSRMEQNALFCTKSGVDVENEMIVSLTTYGKFINKVHITIESLLEQTVKPKKIILWVGDCRDAPPPDAANVAEHAAARA